MKLIKQCLLAPLTSWRMGGVAEIFCQPSTIEDLSLYLAQLDPNTPRFWMGLGSNLLIREGGIKGVVINTRALQTIQPLPDGRVYADAGVTCAKFARFCCQTRYFGGIFFAVIPGTIGGALAMNAGAFGGETWEYVESVKLMDPEGNIVEAGLENFQIGYRSVQTNLYKNYSFIGAYFRFPSHLDKNPQDGLDEIKLLLRKRAESQPIGTFNCGSVYRNPKPEFAARLIEACQLKGYTVGGASVSTKHANFIINHGQATASDIENIMAMIEQTVYDKYQIRLEPEVRIVGIK